MSDKPAPLTDEEFAELHSGCGGSPERFTELFNRWIFWGRVSVPAARGILGPARGR